MLHTEGMLHTAGMLHMHKEAVHSRPTEVDTCMKNMTPSS